MNTITIIEKMKEKDISAPELATKLGVSKKLIYSRLKGKTEFKQSEIVKLSQILEISNDEIFAIFFEQKVS